jgi:hypothetical protein
MMGVKPYEQHIEPMDWQVVEDNFLQRFRELTGN